MKKLVFATHNTNKYREVNEKLSNQFELLSLRDLAFDEEIPEDFETLRENALQKARTIHHRFSVNCFADDTGLEIDALDGRPGVYSARYAGKEANSEKNMAKVLAKLEFANDRAARFRTIIALILDDQEYIFEGVVNGTIATQQSGTSGFGYDPIFIPEGFDRTFSEMSIIEKNSMSHRARAFDKMLNFLSD